MAGFQVILRILRIVCTVEHLESTAAKYIDRAKIYSRTEAGAPTIQYPMQFRCTIPPRILPPCRMYQTKKRTLSIITMRPSPPNTTASRINAQPVMCHREPPTRGAGRATHHDRITRPISPTSNLTLGDHPKRDLLNCRNTQFRQSSSPTDQTEVRCVVSGDVITAHPAKYTQGVKHQRRKYTRTLRASTDHPTIVNFLVGSILGHGTWSVQLSQCSRSRSTWLM